MDTLKRYERILCESNNQSIKIIVRDEAKGKIVERHKYKSASRIDGRLWDYKIRAIGYGYEGRMINLVKEGEN